MRNGKMILPVLLAAALMFAAGCGTQEQPELRSGAVTAAPIQATYIEPEETAQSAPTAVSSEPEDTAAQGDIACPSVSGALQVIGTQLCDENGNPVQLRGVSTHGIAWFPDYINADCFRQLREEWGANVVRLAMYTGDSGGYCTGGDKEQLEALIDEGVQYACDADLYVIIDWHILSDGDPTTYESEAADFFARMSGKYADLDNVLYEICNEPNGGTDWQTIKAYAETIIPAIRANDPDAVILVGTPNWCQYLNDAAADPIADWDNIMYTLHFYAATHKEDLRNTFLEAQAAGLPVFVSEYGICDASGNGDIDEQQADVWAETLDEYGVSYVMWGLCNKDESAALLRPDCGKISDFTTDDLSESGLWLYRMLTGETAGEEETLPAESEDDGLTVSVQCANSWEEDGVPAYQYSVTVKNRSDAPADGWTVTLEFDADPVLTDSWNGNFAVTGRTLTVTAADYNAVVAAGEEAADIGFIVKNAQVTGAAAG